MARAILIIGEPGTGKTRSIKGLNPAETIIIKPNSKDLPFRGAAKNYIPGKNSFTVPRLKALIKDKKITQHGVNTMLEAINNMPHVKNVVIEDLTHFFTKRVVDEINTKGYDKWTQLAADTKTGIIDKETTLRPDLNLIVIGHVSAVTDASGATSIGIQTPGKLMDNTIKIPSYFTYVFHTFVDQDEQSNTRYRFLTNKDGTREAKTPEEMFPKYIDNNLQTVIDGIVQYQNEEGINPVGTTLEQRQANLLQLKAEMEAAAPKTTPTVVEAVIPVATPVTTEEPATEEPPVEFTEPTEDATGKEA